MNVLVKYTVSPNDAAYRDEVGDHGCQFWTPFLDKEIKKNVGNSRAKDPQPNPSSKSRVIQQARKRILLICCDCHAPAPDHAAEQGSKRDLIHRQPIRKTLGKMRSDRIKQGCKNHTDKTQ